MEKKIPIQNIYYMLCYSWKTLDEKEIVQVDPIDSTELVDLFAKVLVGGIHYLIRRGFDRKYLCVNDDLSVIRGKVNFHDSVNRRLPQKGKLSCEYDDLSYNILHNQIIKITISNTVQNWIMNYGRNS